MLNSYKDLRRWFPAVEPQDAVAPRRRPDPELEQALSQGCAARFPHYIRETEPEPFDLPFAGEPTARRSEFIGGWSDWVSDDHAPGPGDDYPDHDAELVQFPWDEDAETPSPRLEPGSARRPSAARRTDTAPDEDTDVDADAVDASDREPARRLSAARAETAPDEGVEAGAVDARDREARGSGRARRGRTPARPAESAADEDAADPAGDNPDRSVRDEPEDTDQPPQPSTRPDEHPGQSSRGKRRGSRKTRATPPRVAHSEWLDEKDDWPGVDDDWLGDDGEWSGKPQRGNGEKAGNTGRRLRIARARTRRESARPETPRTLREQTRPSRLRVAVVLVIAVLLLAAAGGFALYLLHHRGAARAARPAASPVRLTGATTGTTLVCPTERSGAALRGAAPGGTGSGPEAIMWFEHAYYVERSAGRALEVAAPGAAISPAGEIQRGIDSVPPGTAYCVVVAPAGADTYAVQITEQRPGGAPATYDKQTVTTTVAGGRTLITGIAAG